MAKVHLFEKIKWDNYFMGLVPVHPLCLPILIISHVINMPPMSSNISDSSFRVQRYKKNNNTEY